LWQIALGQRIVAAHSGRGSLLNGKVSVIATASQTFTDMIDTARSTRLQILIVAAILAGLVIAVITFVAALK
jgi:uncharacterized Rmd1/YagE family protein